MKRIQKILQINYVLNLIIVLLWIVLNENDVLNIVGSAHKNTNSDFLSASIMEVITICFIPVSLRLFKFGAIRQAIKDDKTPLLNTFFAYSLVRLEMLLMPMLVNAVLYYVFMNVAFGYMAIILFLSTLFIFPTQERCEQEYNTIIQS